MNTQLRENERTDETAHKKFYSRFKGELLLHSEPSFGKLEHGIEVVNWKRDEDRGVMSNDLLTIKSESAVRRESTSKSFWITCAQKERNDETTSGFSLIADQIRREDELFANQNLDRNWK
jgi:hypothetical protein